MNKTESSFAMTLVLCSFVKRAQLLAPMPFFNTNCKASFAKENFPIFHVDRRGLLEGFYTDRSLQSNLGPDLMGTIPYSLEHVNEDGWLIGDEAGRIWQHYNGFLEEILQFPNGVSEITASNRNCVLVGDMHGRLTRLDLANLTEETVQSVNEIDHLAPIKCVRWIDDGTTVATASQDGSIQIADLRSSTRIAHLEGIHSLDAPKNSRSTCTGLVFNPSRPNLFYTSGTPDSDVRCWDLRKLPTKRSKRPVEQFTPLCSSDKRARSSVALTIDSKGARLFLTTSNNNINEFLTCLPEYGPVATYSAPQFTSPSFFSNLTVDPSDRFLLSGTANGSAFIWDTRGEGECVRLPVGSESEVAKTAWIQTPQGGNQIACICDDVAFSLFNWQLDDEQPEVKHAEWLRAGKQVIDRALFEQPTLSMPSTPKKLEAPSSLRSSPMNKSILEYFPRSPRLQ